MKAKRQGSKTIPLKDIGEASLVQRIKAIADRNSDRPFVLDDAAPLWVSGYKGRLLVTTDPAPFPCLVQRVGMGTAYHTGWLVVVKSLSDLAAAGATPVGVTIAAEFWSATTAEEFDEFFKGAADCAEEHGTRVVGGNIKEASDRQHAVAFAIGSRPDDYSMCRNPSEPGDQILLVDGNDWATFWAGIAVHKHPRRAGRLSGNVREYLRERALKPKAQVIAGQILAKTRAVVFSMDTSDGLIATALQLAKNANCSVHLEIDASSIAEPVRSMANSINADPRLWALGWGSCELLFTCRPSDVSRVKGVLRGHGIKCMRVGEVRKGSPHVFVDEGDRAHCISESPFFRGEQFHSDSIWDIGLDKYIDIMLRSSLTAFMTTQNSEDL